ncbi:dTDP-4-dehydrorhamnose reductase family protein [Cupriavidus pinatubonensis]|uniref:dTDP-4-dehydrorhamnose reductase n=1 Tax=Cupriavidus pinatubonensis TaxID=248026 RepID=A0ABM8XJ59_9BURK|nr:SDR family oxidoreductase [Cupriavidus pinatubonensis]CAG9180222.1 dTDP-4-dehydrorhamnose reductase [Cupriavidus pinatubonensis]
MKVLVVGASGMLGSAMFRVLSEMPGYEVFGTIRSQQAKRHFAPAIAANLLVGYDVENHDSLVRLFDCVRPKVVVNCIGLVKQLDHGQDPLYAIPINSMLPHRFSDLCSLVGARLIHVSTDCVFTGNKGKYCEDDPSDATDIYGKTKYLGEVANPHSITLRTSIIGHELEGSRSLLCWFLNQTDSCRGYTKAIFSGLPTVALAQIVRDVVIPRPDLHGLYHVAASPISKYDLLSLIAEIYGKKISIVPDDTIIIDRSLDANRFRLATGYTAPDWRALIELMKFYK